MRYTTLSAGMAETMKQRSGPYTEIWCYETGLVLKALEMIGTYTGTDAYGSYIQEMVDRFVQPDGTIRTYTVADYNLDQICEGRLLFGLYRKTGEDRYLRAADVLRGQLDTHPRTAEGGFWHKNIYPHQMWLDGIYMACPFYTEYGVFHTQTQTWEDVARQIRLVHSKTLDATTGLMYHGWDESRKQAWANPETGCSPHFWGRAMGWYAMALVDVLESFPETHPERGSLLDILTGVLSAVLRVQDAATGLWFQVLDQGGREGNYLEASASCMFVYALLKAVRMGYVSDAITMASTQAKRAFEGILTQFLRRDEAGSLHLHDICRVAGLGGNPYRDGSYNYYVNEPRAVDDNKGTGPFIMAALEMEKTGWTWDGEVRKA